MNLILEDKKDVVNRIKSNWDEWVRKDILDPLKAKVTGCLAECNSLTSLRFREIPSFEINIVFGDNLRRLSLLKAIRKRLTSRCKLLAEVLCLVGLWESIHLKSLDCCTWFCNSCEFIAE